MNLWRLSFKDEAAAVEIQHLQFCSFGRANLQQTLKEMHV